MAFLKRFFQHKKSYSKNKLFLACFSTLKKILNIIASYSYEQRIRILKLKPDRADVIIPSGNIYKLVMESTNANKIIVPKVGLSDGIIINLFLKEELALIK